MNTINQSTAQAVNQPFFSAMSTIRCPTPWRELLAGLLVTAGLACAAAAPAWSSSDSEAKPAAAALEQWHTSMAQNPPQEAGCFRESYPSVVREKVDCYGGAPQRAHPMPHMARGGGPSTVGNGDDYVAATAGKTIWAGGSFLDVSVQSVTTVGGQDAIDGPNEYELQINTNASGRTSAFGCNTSSHPGCHVWQQFLYATDYDCNLLGFDCTAGVYIEYWLLDYGPCPSGSWNQSGNNCWINSNISGAPDFPITNLANVSLHAAASRGGQDCVAVYDDTGGGWDACTSDSMLEISSVWDQTEFNIFGDTGAAQAQFNSGANLAVLLQVNDGTNDAPTCVRGAGTTGETNNLTLSQPCEPLVGNGLYPRIRFTEFMPNVAYWDGSKFKQSIQCANSIGVGPNSRGLTHGTPWIAGCYEHADGNYDVYEMQTPETWVDMQNDVATQVAVSPEGNAWAINAAGDILYWNGSKFVPNPTGGCATSISVGPNAFGLHNGTPWITGCHAYADGNYDVYQMQKDGDWHKIQSDVATQVSVSPNGLLVWALKAGGIILGSVNGEDFVDVTTGINYPGSALQLCATSIAAVEDASIWLTSCLYTSGGPFNGNEPVYQLNPFGGTVQLMQGDVAIGIAASPEGSVWATSID